jgi:WD40 repeat protein
MSDDYDTDDNNSDTSHCDTYDGPFYEPNNFKNIIGINPKANYLYNYLPEEIINKICDYIPVYLQIMSDDNTNIGCFDIFTNKLQCKFIGHTGVISNIMFFPDNQKIISCSYDKTIRIWNAITQETISIISLNDIDLKYITIEDISPDGTKIIFFNKKTIYDNNYLYIFDIVNNNLIYKSKMYLKKASFKSNNIIIMTKNNINSTNIKYISIININVYEYKIDINKISKVYNFDINGHSSADINNKFVVFINNEPLSIKVNLINTNNYEIYKFINISSNSYFYFANKIKLSKNNKIMLIINRFNFILWDLVNDKIIKSYDTYNHINFNFTPDDKYIILWIKKGFYYSYNIYSTDGNIIKIA